MCVCGCVGDVWCGVMSGVECECECECVCVCLCVSM